MQTYFLTKVLSLPMEIIHVKFSANATQELKLDKELLRLKGFKGFSV